MLTCSETTRMPTAWNVPFVRRCGLLVGSQGVLDIVYLAWHERSTRALADF